MDALLQKLRLEPVNLGTCCGRDRWPLETHSQPLISFNPTTGEPIASVIPASSDSYHHIVETAQTSFLSWREMPAPQRGLVVRDIGNALRNYLEPLGELVSLEMGKIRAEGMGEVQEMIDICDFAVGLSRQLYGLTMPSERPRHRMMEQWHPLGPVGVITAFNFPVAVWSWNAAIAAVCGNTLVWKPSELTPLTAIAVQHIVNDVMADHGLFGIFNLVIGGPAIGELLTRDPRLPLVSFTGSIRTGRAVAQNVAARLGRSLLELGGNNAIIVAPDADLDLATRGIVFGAVGTAGQRCTSTRRLIMHESIATDMTRRLKRAYKQVNIGDPLSEDTLMGPLVTSTAVNQMEQAIAQAIREGGEIIAGGRVRPDLGPQFVEPTLIKMPGQTPIVQEETFAPILYLFTYNTIEEAIRLNNNVPQGLSSAIFTDSLRTAETFLSVAGSDCGIANINIGTSGAEIGGAFGGEKETGGGREAGSDSWKIYMRRQTVTINGSGQLPLAQGVKFDV